VHQPFKLLAPPTVSKRNRHGFFGIILANDETVELRNDLAGGKTRHIFSIKTLVLV